MGKNFSTDLAAEARDLWAKSGERHDLPGLTARREQRNGFSVDVVEIAEHTAEEKLCKPIGRYVTVELDTLFRREEDAFRRACGVLSGELRRQLRLSPGAGVLVACLGNRDITPDAVGPLCARYVMVTKHLKERLPEDFGAFRSVTLFCPGVLGTTGMESAELVKSAAEISGCGAVVAVDALSARETGRLCRAVQITDAGIVPGSGVGNARSELSRRTLGVPTVAVGVPTVVDLATVCSDLTGVIPDGAEGHFVTPRDIDARVRDVARLIGYSIDLALHEGLTVEDVDMFTA